jgi:hypothetical protein
MCDALEPDTLVKATVSRVCGVNLPLGVKASCRRAVDDGPVVHIVVADKSVRSHAALGAPNENPRTAATSRANSNTVAKENLSEEKEKKVKISHCGNSQHLQ